MQFMLKVFQSVEQGKIVNGGFSLYEFGDTMRM